MGPRARRASALALLCILCASSLPALGEAPVASLGKQHAARSPIEWDVRDIDHPQLGPIRYAVQKSAVATAARGERIVSLAFVSCQRSSGKVAIELTNAPESDPAGGLRPTGVPRLVCRGPATRGKSGLAKGDIAARWEIGPLGDTLARGLSPSRLRGCVSIDVLQSLALPPGPSQGTYAVAMEIAPYAKALDSVFVACGEASAFAGGGEAPRAAAPAAKANPAPDRDPATRPAEGPWEPARTIARGRTNVRAQASVDSPLVIRLAPGTRILVQRAASPWWRVKPRSGAAFRGFIREDRLAFE